MKAEEYEPGPLEVVGDFAQSDAARIFGLREGKAVSLGDGVFVYGGEASWLFRFKLPEHRRYIELCSRRCLRERRRRGVSVFASRLFKSGRRVPQQN